MQLSKNRLGIILVCLLGLFVPTAIGAQTPAETVNIHVHDERVIEGANSLFLDVYFALRDEANRSDPQSIVQSAMIHLETGEQYEAQIEKPPFYIALVLDASGSMREALGDARQAAIDAVMMAPAEVYFAVIRFDESIDLLQPFSNNRDETIQALNQIRIDDSGTCLYDVAHTAVQALDQIAQNAPRRAMLLFTDGRDEIRQGFGDTCSRSTYTQLLTFAQNRIVPVPIHTIGISDNRTRINLEELSRLSQATGGLSAGGDETVLTGLFQQIMDDVRSQWVAHAALKPTEGYHRGVVYLTLTDARLPSAAPVDFISTRNYFIPPQRVTLDVGNLVYNETADIFLLDVTLANFQEVNRLQVDIIDTQSNLRVAESAHAVIWQNQQIRLETTNLQEDARYLARVQLYDAAGQLMTNERGHPIQAQRRFLYAPPPEPVEMVFTLRDVRVQDEAATFDLPWFTLIDDQPEMILTLQVRNGAAISQINGYLLPQGRTQQKDEFRNIVLAANNTVRLPFNANEGIYTIVLDAVGEDGNTLFSTSKSFTHISPDGPLVRARKALEANPVISAVGLALIILAALIGLLIGLWFSRRWANSAVARKAAADKKEKQRIEQTPVVAAAPAHLARLKVIESPDKSVITEEGWTVRTPYTIGRENCDLTIPGDNHISRKHAEITLDNGVYYIKDFGSSNGTFINETKIAANKPTPLSADVGATIRIGKTTRLTLNEEPVTNGTAPH